MNGRGCRGWKRCGGTNYCRGCTRNCDNNGRVVVKCVRNTNDRKWVIGTVGGRNCDQGGLVFEELAFGRVGVGHWQLQWQKEGGAIDDEFE